MCGVVEVETICVCVGLKKRCGVWPLELMLFGVSYCYFPLRVTSGVSEWVEVVQLFVWGLPYLAILDIIRP